MKNIQGPIALLGTSADPPTLGHEALLKGLLSKYPKVATWASNNPQKKHEECLTKRSELLNILVKSIDNPNLELIDQLSSPWTITTLEIAKNKWPNTELVFVIGSDLARDIPHWFQANKILTTAKIAIAPRKGWPIKNSHLEKLKSLGARIELLQLNIPATASSDIRDETKTHQIPSSVLQVLLKQKLYGISMNNS